VASQDRHMSRALKPTCFVISRIVLSLPSVGGLLVSVVAREAVPSVAAAPRTLPVPLASIAQLFAPVDGTGSPITGNKLQGLTKDSVIVYSLNRNTNWIYVVLSRVRTLKGLYLMKRLKLREIKPPSADYLDFMSCIKKLEQVDLERFRQTH